jgi:hypothetical protein
MLTAIIRMSLTFAICLMAVIPLRADDDERTREAIKRAVEYLKANYQSDRNPPSTVSNPGEKPGLLEGGVALAGIALLEAGVKPNDPVIQSIAGMVRNAALDQTRTYHISMDVIFLDKLSEPADTPLIQSMGARIMMGQDKTGGWSYNVPDLDDQEKDRMRGVMKGAVMKSGAKVKPDGSLESRPDMDPTIAQILSGRHIRPIEDVSLNDDNSNTQFALLALWSARRHGLPAEKALSAVERRFQTTQFQNGGWSYEGFAPNRVPTPSMTCAALLGLAVGSGVKSERVMKSKGATINPDGTISVSGSKGVKPPPNPLASQHVQAGLRFIGAAMNGGQGVQPMGGMPTSGDLRSDLYFLWSLERVAVIFNIKTVGGKDWFKWGREWLLNNQNKDGSFYTKWGNRADTSFALMFLLQANIVRDLTRVLKSSGEIKPSEGAPNRKSDSASSSKSSSEKSSASASNSSKEDKVSKLVKALIDAGEAGKIGLLKEYTKGLGAEYTMAIAEAIPKLKGQIKDDARDALAERIADLSAPKVKEYLTCDDPELRRAGALAVYMKTYKGLIPDLINAIDDPEEIVWSAAGLALRKMTNQKFGPRRSDTDIAVRKKAKAEWEAWFKEHGTQP